MTGFLGLDTSNYTTSAAVCRADGSGYNSSQLLTVKPGELGLRQNEALFQHVKNLPQRFAELREAGFLQDIAAVGASTQPRAVEGSYMPCFLAGASQGRILAETLGVPFYAFSHQQGHIAAVCWAATMAFCIVASCLRYSSSFSTRTRSLLFSTAFSL